MSDQCRICGRDAAHPSYEIREMMYGSREEFRYFQCLSCGCLQIAEIPKDLGRYYPDNYYSYSSKAHLNDSWWRQFRYAAGAGSARLLNRFLGRLVRPPKHLAWVDNARLTAASRILDVGCGSGKYLLKMHLGGFKHCIGLDPFIRETIRYPNGVTVHKQELQEFAARTGEEFDLVMFHHSLEHMEDPQAMLHAASTLLSEQGTILVRVPIADSYAWQHYREHWIQIDAPRHLYLFTQKSLELLAGQVELAVDLIEFDSTKLQLICSELYRRDIPGNAPKRDKNIFSGAELRDIRRKVRELNRSRQGDQAAFYLRRVQVDR